MGFSKIVGHTRAISILRRAVRTGRVAHAYLFVGPEGVGKATVAWSFVRTLQCREQKGEACGACESCIKISHGNHPDVLGVEPRKGQIRIDQVRDLQRQMIHRPLEGRWRTIVIDEAHHLTPQAANALLKTLEEPPAGNVMVLVARSTSSLLPTVVSRCQVLHFPPLSPSEISLLLRQGKGWPEADALRAAIQAQGSIRRALALREHAFLEEGTQLTDFLVILSTLSDAEILQRAGAWAGSREKARVGLEFMQSLFRDLVLLKLGCGFLANQDMEEALRSLAPGWSLQALLSSWEWVVEALRGIERNWNTLMVMEDLFLRVGGINRRYQDNGGAQ